MNKLRKFALFWYDFIVGDDWALALGVVIGLTMSALLVQHNLHADWYLLPIVIIATLAISLWRATHHNK